MNKYDEKEILEWKEKAEKYEEIEEMVRPFWMIGNDLKWYIGNIKRNSDLWCEYSRLNSIQTEIDGVINVWTLEGILKVCKERDEALKDNAILTKLVWAKYGTSLGYDGATESVLEKYEDDLHKRIEELESIAKKYNEAMKGLNNASLDIFGKKCNFELNEMVAHNLFVKSVSNTDKDLCIKYGNALKRIEELEKALECLVWYVKDNCKSDFFNTLFRGRGYDETSLTQKVFDDVIAKNNWKCYDYDYLNTRIDKLDELNYQMDDLLKYNAKLEKQNKVFVEGVRALNIHHEEDIEYFDIYDDSGFDYVTFCKGEKNKEQYTKIKEMLEVVEVEDDTGTSNN